MCKDCRETTDAAASVGSTLRGENRATQGSVGLERAVAEKSAAEAAYGYRRELSAVRTFQEREFKSKLADLKRFIMDNLPQHNGGEIARFKLDEVELWGKKALSELVP